MFMGISTSNFDDVGLDWKERMERIGKIFTLNVLALQFDCKSFLSKL